MRVLQVINSLNPALGGTVQCVRQVGSALMKLGVHVEVACLDDRRQPWLQEFPMKVHALGPATMKFAYCPQYVRWLKAFGTQYDVAIVNGIWQFHSVATWFVLRKSATPYLIYTHGMLDPWNRYESLLKYAKKWIYWNLFEYQVLRDAAGVVFTSVEERRLARAYFARYSAKELLIELGIEGPGVQDGGSGALRSREALVPNGRRMLLYLGRLHPTKGCEPLIRGFAEAYRTNPPPVHLVLAGAGEPSYVAKLQRLTKTLGVESYVSFVGLLDVEAKWAALRQSDALILPSFHENFGFAIVESLACGKPVLISDRVNIWPTVVASGAGVVCTPDVAGVVSAIRKWLEMRPEDQELLRASARKCFEEKFDVRGTAAHLRREMEVVCARRASGEST